MLLRMLLSNIVLVLVLNIITDLYFYKYFILRFTRSKVIKWTHWILDFLFVATIAVIYIMMYSDSMISHRLFQWFMIVYLIVYIPKFVYMVFSLPTLFCRNRKINFVFYGLGALIGTIMLCSFIYGVTIGPTKLRVARVELYFPNLPDEFNGYKIAFFSDTHLGNMRSGKVLESALDEIGVIEPDLIAFGGDLVHSRSDEAFRFEELLRRFHAPDGVYAVLGNHDYHDPKSRAVLGRFYEDINWRLLNNESEVIRRDNDSLLIMGVENWGIPPFPQYGDVERAMEGAENTEFKILISHDPTHWQEVVAEDTDIELTLSGHTHGMQFAVNFFGRRFSPASFKYDYWGGLYRNGNQYLYVNEGMGVVLFPFRLGALPELTIIVLKKK